MKEITMEEIRQQVDDRHPEIRPFLEKANRALYQTLWVGDLFPRLVQCQAAAGKVLEQGLPAELPPVQVLDRAVSLFLAAFDDAWFEADLSGAGYELEQLQPVPRCPSCHEIERVSCRCLETAV